MVLIVEDMLVVRMYFKDCLVEYYFVCEVENGLVVWEFCFLELLDIVVSDVMMLGGFGFEFSECICGNKKINYILLVFFIGKNIFKDWIEGLWVGVDVYFIKLFY